MDTSVKKSIWIYSPWADSTFFIFAGFLGLIFGFLAPHLGSLSIGLTFLIYFGLGLPHFGSTWFFYMDSSNRHYFDQKPWAFYYLPFVFVLAPIGLAIGGKVGGFAELAAAAILITYWFSGYHVMKQSVGITSLYRGRLGLFDKTEREIDNRVIMSAAFLALFGRYLFFTDFGYERFFREYHGEWLVWGLLAFFAYSFIRWVAASVGRFRAHGKNAWPLFLFSTVSILLFTPFLYVADFQVAFMSNLLGHYSQYLVLVWLINRNKYVLMGEHAPKAPLLAYLTKHLYLYAGVLLVYAIGVMLVGSISVLLPVVGLTWAHFFIDRFLFRFKDPEMRKLILPYI